MISEKVLFVDDEQNVLDGIRRQFRKEISIETALGPVEGLRVVNKKGPFAVVVSDIRMPLIDGIKFLSRVREIAPDSVRMILTGNADLDAAIKAVNDGNVFRFLTKPCPAEVLLKVLRNGIEQYRLIRSERELLEQTLKGSIKILTEMLSLLNPGAFERAARTKRYAVEIALNMGFTELWKIETAAMLSQIGFVTLPEFSFDRLYKGEELTSEEKDLFDRHPQVAFDLLKHIPRMQEVAEIIRDQNKQTDLSKPPGEGANGQISREARILKTVLDFDLLLISEGSPKKALQEIKEMQGWYDPAIVESLAQVLDRPTKYEQREVALDDLRPGMIIEKEVRTLKGLLLITPGQEVGYVSIERLRNYARSDQGVQEPIRVQAPVLEPSTTPE